MAFSLNVFDEHDHKLATLSAAHAVYVLPDGSADIINSHVVYCCRCHAFRLGEHLQSAEEFETHLKELQQLPPAWQDDPVLGEISRKAHQTIVQDAMKLQEHLRSRHSPARCLECGSTQIRPLDEGHGYVPHPAGPGRVRLEVELHFEPLDAPPRYTIEGTRLPDNE